MIYASTRRPFWNLPRTALKFTLTSALLGLPTALLVWLAAAICLEELTVERVMAEFGAAICLTIALLAFFKLLAELAIFASLTSRQFTPLKRTASLLVGDLSRVTFLRFACGITGGLILPVILAGRHFAHAAPEPSAPLVVSAAIVSLILLIAGELLERYMFFAAVVAPKIPGAPAT
jgi:DMSO reductase anchor subunit